MGRLLGLLACLLASPALAVCVTLPAEDFAALDFGSAERFDQGEALLVIAGMMNTDVATVLASKATGKTTTLWALPVGSQVLIIRQTGPTTLCSDEPVDRSVFESGKLRTLPREG